MGSAAPAFIGAVAVAGLGLHALPGEPDLARPRLVVVPAPARTAAAIAPVRPKPSPAARAAAGFVIPETAVEIGHLGDAQVRTFHARVGWDGAASPGVWATPATFSVMD